MHRVIACEQGTAEWLAARRGVATASRASDALAVLRSGAPAKAALDYAQELAFERVAQCVVDKPVTVAMQRGKELEPLARAAYEARTGELVEELGFVLHHSLLAGASPDGLVGDFGLVEIKCPFSHSQLAKIWAGNDVSDYTDQVDWQLWVLQRQWCDVVIYDPRLEHSGMDLLIVRHYLTETARKRLDERVPEFLELVDSIEANIRSRRK
jgi:exodeoxyribonuclease (lambda-induced)